MSPRTTILSSCWTSPEVGSLFATGNKCLGLVLTKTSRHPYCQKALYDKRIRDKSQRGSGPAVFVRSCGVCVETCREAASSNNSMQRTALRAAADAGR